MIYQAEHTASLLNESYTFQSVLGKNSNFTRSINEMPFYFRSCELTSRVNLCIHAGGQITYTVPVRFEQSPLPYAVFFLVTSGNGIFTLREQEISVCANDILFIPAGEFLHFTTTHTLFSYNAFYVSGSAVEDFLSAICQKEHYFFKNCAHTDSTIWRLLPSILRLLSSDTKEASLHLSTLFHIAFSSILDMQCKANAILTFPSHVTQMKQIFDSNYQCTHSLESLEQELGVNKYRLCRDFSTYIGKSPVQYLNQVRLQEARHLLRTTDLTIREVGISVGIENTTHFINLFKKNTGITPLQFRQNHRL